MIQLEQEAKLFSRALNKAREKITEKKINEAYVAVSKDDEYEPHQYRVMNPIAAKIMSWLNSNDGKVKDGKDLVIALDDDEIKKELGEDKAFSTKFTYEEAFDHLRSVFGEENMGSIYNIVSQYLDLRDSKGKPLFNPSDISDPASLLNKYSNELSKLQGTKKRELNKILSTFFFIDKSKLKDQLFFIKDLSNPKAIQVPYMKDLEQEKAQYFGQVDPAWKKIPGRDEEEELRKRIRYASKKTGQKASVACSVDINNEAMLQAFGSIVYVPPRLNAILNMSAGEIGPGEFLVYFMIDPKLNPEFQPGKAHKFIRDPNTGGWIPNPNYHNGQAYDMDRADVPVDLSGSVENDEDDEDEESGAYYKQPERTDNLNPFQRFLRDRSSGKKKMNQSFYDIVIDGKYWHIKDLRASSRAVEYGMRISERTKRLSEEGGDILVHSLKRTLGNDSKRVTRANLVYIDNAYLVISELVKDGIDAHGSRFSYIRGTALESPKKAGKPMNEGLFRKNLNICKEKFIEGATMLERALDEMTRRELRNDTGEGPSTGKHQTAGVIAVVGGSSLEGKSMLNGIVFIPLEECGFYRFSSKGLHFSVVDMKIGDCMGQAIADRMDSIINIRNWKMKVAPVSSEGDIDLPKEAEKYYGRPELWWLIACANGGTISPVLSYNSLSDMASSEVMISTDDGEKEDEDDNGGAPIPKMDPKRKSKVLIIPSVDNFDGIFPKIDVESKKH